MKITWKKALTWAGAFVAYRLYKVYELGQSFQWYVSKFYPTRVGGNSFQIVVEYEIVNPTNTTLNVRGISGDINYRGTKIGTFQGAPFTMRAGKQIYKVYFTIPNNIVVKTITDIVSKNQFPVFTVNMVTLLPVGKFKQTFNINTQDYAEAWANQIVLWK